MKLIIDISEDALKEMKTEEFISIESLDTAIECIKNGTPLDDVKAEIKEERECAYADFDKYKVDYLGVDSRYVEDELPYDDFRYGMERCLEIIDKHIGKENK